MTSKPPARGQNVHVPTSFLREDIAVGPYATATANVGRQATVTHRTTPPHGALGIALSLCRRGPPGLWQSSSSHGAPPGRMRSIEAKPEKELPLAAYTRIQPYSTRLTVERLGLQRLLYKEPAKWKNSAAHSGR
jgi:hypothetical protein